MRKNKKSQISLIKRFSGFILYALITVLIISLYLDKHSSLEKLELGLQDLMFKLRGQTEVPQDIVLVAIDDPTITQIGRWPWRKDKTANFISALSSQKPKTIFVDMPFAYSDEKSDTVFTDSLALAIKKAGNVVLGYHYSLTDMPMSAQLLPQKYISNSYSNFNDASHFGKYPPLIATKIFITEPRLADASANLGYLNTDFDEDKNIRHKTLLLGYRGNFFPAAEAAAAANFLDMRIADIHVDIGEAIKLGHREIPLDTRGRMRINYNGPAGTFKSYSAADIINGKIATGELAGKLVIVGYTAFGSTEVYATPVSNSLTGVEISANIVENILHNNVLRGADSVVNINLLVILVIGLFSAFVLPRISLLNRFAVLVLFLVVLVNINYILFSAFSIISKTLYAGLEIILLMAAAPLIKVGGASILEPGDDEDDEELDYETLLSSSQSLKVADYPVQAPPKSIFNQTAYPRQAPSPQSTSAISSTMPMGGGSVKTQVAVAVAEPVPTDHFGRYKVLETIGKGAMGTVYKGLDPAIDRLVALKTIRMDQIMDPEESGELRERLTREAKAAGKLSHPNIVTIYDVGEEGPIQYIAMEYLQGRTIEQLLRGGIDWDYRTLSKIMIQVCEALDYAHENGIVHRDIKPANIMIVENDKVKVMDFGIARLDKSASMTQTGTALGTPNYISPEQLKGLNVDRRSDIFSLGVVFYELLTKERPFKGDTISALIYSILHTNPPPPSEINFDIPRIFDKIIAKALVKDPDLRFQRAKDLSDILRKLI
jgi:CHASE2 domain-containing sensor protein/tRNA A-37 threonylcarbamoyl transferase component Bud32